MAENAGYLAKQNRGMGVAVSLDKHRRVKMGIRARKTTADIVSYIILGMGTLIMVLPFLWMVSTSLKSNAEAFLFPPTVIPKKILWENYPRVWKYAPFHIFTWNTFYTSTLITLAQLLTSSMAGYAFARLKFPGRDMLFLGYIALLMIPGQVTMIPTFIIMRRLGWIDSRLSIIIPSLASPFGTFLMRQFFLGVPLELEEAAKLDGCNRFGIYWRIFLPLSKPALTTLGIFVFMGSWNSFLWPLIMLNSVHKKTITLGLTYFQGVYATEWTLMMAAAVMALLPILLVYLFGQKYFIEGIALSGIKG